MVTTLDEEKVDRFRSERWDNAMQHRGEQVVLGLRKGTVELAPHRPEWRVYFLEERERLMDVLAANSFRIKHIGSTSVPGLPAKPILDLAVLIMQPELMSVLQSKLISKGYIYRGDKGRDGGQLFVFEKSAEVRTVHLHALVYGDPQWLGYLRFRNALDADNNIRDKYARLKVRLAEECHDNRFAYTSGKYEYIQRVLSVM